MAFFKKKTETIDYNFKAEEVVRYYGQDFKGIRITKKQLKEDN